MRGEGGGGQIRICPAIQSVRLRCTVFWSGQIKVVRTKIRMLHLQNLTATALNLSQPANVKELIQDIFMNYCSIHLHVQSCESHQDIQNAKQ